MTSDTLCLTTVLGRQPILDAAGELYGYELLHRRLGEDRAVIDDAEGASRTVIANSLMSFDLDRLVQGQRLFINVTDETLRDGIVRLLPAGRTVLELLETVEITPELKQMCHALRNEGFVVALDDVVDVERSRAMEDVIGMVKVDFMDTDPETRARIAEAVLSVPGRTLLAEKVETPEEFEEARALGFELFQGFFFSRPSNVESLAARPQKTAILQLLSRVIDPHEDLEELEQTIRQDASLSYQLLRTVNSCYYGLRCPVTSIRGSIVMLGTVATRRWASLMLMTAAAEDSSAELIRMTLVRARFCETHGALVAPGCSAGDLFLVGLFSSLDVVLGCPMEEVLEPLPLDEGVRAALLGENNALRRTLDLCRPLEAGEWKPALGDRSATVEHLTAVRHYLEALTWTDDRLAAQGAFTTPHPA